jgi:hypothetical protein
MIVVGLSVFGIATYLIFGGGSRETHTVAPQVTAVPAAVPTASPDRTSAASVEPGRTGEPAKHSSGITREQAAADYEEMAARLNPIQTEFHERARRWDDSTSNEQAVSDARPFVEALAQAVSSLRDIAAGYPPAAAPLEADARAATTLRDDLLGLSHLRSIGLDAWIERYNDDRSRVAAASNDVRRALGLPKHG